MAQRLIVEGNDAIILATLCKKRRLKPPAGYEEEVKFIREFVKVGNGYTGAIEAFRTSLDEPDLSNLGLIVDANDKGAAARWQEIRNILAEKYQPDILSAADLQFGPKVIQEEELPTIGIWIMPDNAGLGYLEHFLAELVPAGDALWSHTNYTLQNLLLQPFNVITPVKQQKALLHTWLAWQKDPGKPFGQALQAGYFNDTAPAVQPFLDWFGSTFSLTT